MMQYVLATSLAEPDAAFATLRQLAQHILAVRDRAGGAGQAIRLVPATMGREQLPEGVTIAVRRMDGSARGERIGYAFLPRQGGGFAPMAKRLAAAIAEAEQANAVRRAA
jgi:hypothetical protein